MDKLTLKNMHFYAYHGVLPEEQEKGQNFYIDADMFLDLTASGDTDDLEDTVNYAKVYALVKAVTENNRFQLIEKLAGSISREILSAFEKIEEVRVTVRKPEAPIDGELDWAAVEVRRTRHGT